MMASGSALLYGGVFEEASELLGPIVRAAAVVVNGSQLTGSFMIHPGLWVTRDAALWMTDTA